MMLGHPHDSILHKRMKYKLCEISHSTQICLYCEPPVRNDTNNKMAEVRRCRRCKRKRMDDEPPEVRQYKTCAKCRIIERQKKKLRKPLAEETMLYGMKQFQQQNQNLNFTHDDIFMDDEVFAKKKFDSNLNPNLNQYQYQYSYLSGTPGGGSSGNGGMGGAAGSGAGSGGVGIGGDASGLENYDTSRLTGNATASTIPQTNSNNFHLQNLHYQQIAQRALPMQSTNLPKSSSSVSGSHNLSNNQFANSNLTAGTTASTNGLNINNNNFENSNSTNSAPVYCDICETKLDLSDELSTNYKLCVSCYSNPFKLYNVHEDYNDFLLQLLNNKVKSINNLIFLKEIDRNFVDNLNSYNKVINNEHQFREFLLDNLKKIFIEPIIATIGYEFQLISTNLNELSKQPPIMNANNQYNYHKTNPIKVYYKCMAEINNSINCESNLFLDFNLFNNFLKIKFNHKIHNSFLSYPLKFIGLIYDVFNELKQSSSEDITSKLGYNAYTGELIYDKLTNDSSSLASDEDCKTLISGLDKEVFVKDFPHVEEIITKNESKLINKQYSATSNDNDNNNTANSSSGSGTGNGETTGGDDHDIDTEIVNKLNLANAAGGSDEIDLNQSVLLSDAVNLDSINDSTADKSITEELQSQPPQEGSSAPGESAPLQPDQEDLKPQSPSTSKPESNPTETSPTQIQKENEAIDKILDPAFDG